MYLFMGCGYSMLSRNCPSLCIYIYMCVCVCMCVCMYVCIVLFKLTKQIGNFGAKRQEVVMALTVMLILQLNVFIVSIYLLCFMILNNCFAFMWGYFRHFLIRDWIVGGNGGREKIFSCRNAKKQY